MNNVGQPQKLEPEFFRKAILPVCGGYEKPHDSIIHTIGNGILFEYDGYIWILSVRHLIEPEAKDHTVKVVLKWQGTNYILILNKPQLLHYHPLDNNDFTLDLALYCFGKEKNFQIKYPFFRLSDHSRSFDLNHEDDLQIIGYPSHLLNPKIIFQDKFQPIQTFKGSFIDEELSIKPQDYNRKFIKQRILQLRPDQTIELSGSLVLKPQEDMYIPIGIVTGTGKVKMQLSPDSQVIESNIVSFTPLSYLFEMF